MADLSDIVRTRHKVSGVIDENTPLNIVEHPILGKHLEIVGPDAKPYLPEMHRVSLPADATDEQKAVADAAIAAGLVDEDVVVKDPVAELAASREAAKDSKTADNKNEA